MSAQHRTIAGYRSRLTVQAGDHIDFMVSSFDEAPYEADLVRIISGNTRASYSGLELEEISAPFAGRYQGHQQTTRFGSYATARLTGWPTDKSFSFVCAAMPTTRERGDTSLFVLMGENGVRFELGFRSTGVLFVELVDGVGMAPRDVELPEPCPLKRWSIVGVSYNAADGQVQLFQSPQPEGPGDTAALFAATTERTVGQANMTFDLAAFAARPLTNHEAAHTTRHFNGRIDAPRLVEGIRSPQALHALVVATSPDETQSTLAFWDFAADMSGRTFDDLGSLGAVGMFHNLPVRAVKGIRWTGAERDWRNAPHHYSAVHFHEDTVYDAGWNVAFSYQVPAGLRSGAYAARLQKGEETEYLLFFVTPESPTANIAFLASTASYLAYANERVGITVDSILEGKFNPLPEEQMLLDNPQFGLSHYDHHLDGYGIHFSSYLRPTVNWRPDTRVWAFNADTDILRWLERNDQPYDLITDERLHAQGVAALDGYDVVITGTHPEYYSTDMLNGLESFLGRGGRLMYMGGNGFYWRIAQSPAWPAAIELRRAEDGTRAWMSLSGEYHHQFDGELGGLWRRQNRAPQKLVGVGFAAQGSAKGLRFRKSAAAANPRVGFAFEGVSEEILADFKRMQATPNAEELDRVDYELGTPSHALVLASSENTPPDMMRTKEELLIALPQIPDPDTRADVVFFETPAGGAVFSTGSIGWSSVLAYQDYQNPAAQLTTNVLNRFADPEPFKPVKTEAPINTLTPQVYALPPGMRAHELAGSVLIKSAFAKAVMVVVLSLVAKFRGLPLLTPEPRQEPIGLSLQHVLDDKQANANVDE